MGEWFQFVVGAVAVVVFGIQALAVFTYLVASRKLKRISRLWDAGRLDEHLETCETLLQKARPGSFSHDRLSLRYAEHLIVVGRWVEAQAAIARVARPRRHAVLLYMKRDPLLLHVLLLQGKFEDAQQLHDELFRHVERQRHDISSYQYIRFVTAIYEFYLGEMATACGMLHNLATEQPPRYERAQVLYFLGCAEYELGRTKDATTHIEKATELGAGTYVSDAVAAFWEQHAKEGATTP